MIKRFFFLRWYFEIRLFHNSLFSLQLLIRKKRAWKTIHCHPNTLINYKSGSFTLKNKSIPFWKPSYWVDSFRNTCPVMIFYHPDFIAHFPIPYSLSNQPYLSPVTIISPIIDRIYCINFSVIRQALTLSKIGL